MMLLRLHSVLRPPSSLVSHDNKTLHKPSQWEKYLRTNRVSAAQAPTCKRRVADCLRFRMLLLLLFYLVLSAPSDHSSKLNLTNRAGWFALVWGLFLEAAKARCVIMTTRWSPVISLKRQHCLLKGIPASTVTQSVTGHCAQVLGQPLLPKGTILDNPGDQRVLSFSLLWAKYPFVRLFRGISKRLHLNVPRPLLPLLLLTPLLWLFLKRKSILWIPDAHPRASQVAER